MRWWSPLALLRAVYRLLFLFVTEDRGALLHPSAPFEARERYARFFSPQRLRELARRRRGGRHGDLWRALGVVLSGLGSEEGWPEIGLAGIGGAASVPSPAGLGLTPSGPFNLGDANGYRISELGYHRAPPHWLPAAAVVVEILSR